MSVLGLDLGTTGCKAAAFSGDGRCIAQAYREYRTLHPGPGLAELDSLDVWDKVRGVISEVAGQSRGDPVSALCVSSCGEAVVPVTSARQILDNSILCMDPRGADHAARLEREIGQEDFFLINPNLLGPQYSLPKILWTRDNRPEVFDRAEYFLLWGDLVGFMLGCEAVTANSLANRTLLFDLDRNDWSDRLLEWSGIPRGLLGRVEPGGTVIGEVAGSVAAELGLARGVKVVTGGHDQCCNALGTGAIRAGSAVCGIGTFECITPVYARVKEPLSMLAEGLNIEHHVLPDLYVSFIFNQGAVLVKWFRDTFAAADVPPAGQDIYALLNQEMPGEPTRLLALPHFQPPMSPRYIPDSSGVILGLKTSTTRGEILKAVMECETFYFVDSIEALRRMGIETTEFVASGGGAKSDAWLQIKADIFGIPFVRPRISEGSLLGAAMLAGLATGVFGSPAEAVGVFVQQDRTFEPDADRHAVYRERVALYRRLFPATHDLSRELGASEV